ncbi:VacJ family lipoprotein [Candidatus Pelagibacter sp. Uisw_130]|uniref:MlaA family lipoprotein n=1 Tax=Candidatus Pelagibacter sp. Uisw_130 TaxID=3230989 RepID=UPI0039E744C5
MKKIIITSLISLMLATNASADTDSENNLSKRNPGEVKDCFEGVNRATFKFNQVLDGAIFQPVAKAYRVLPSPVRAGTSNALDNISTLVTIPNNILQGELSKAGVNTGRFIVNTTFGIVGIFDVAEKIGFPEYEKEDYGQTLGVMGVGEGCYLVLPVLGPSTARDTFGSLANLMGGDPWYNITTVNDTQYFSDFDYWASRAGTGIDFRAKNLDSFENLEKNSMDFYASVRSLYLQDRQQKIGNSNKITETQNDSDWEEIETQ